MDQVNVALVGAGSWGNNILRTLSRIDDANVKLVCDIDTNQIKRLAREYPAIIFTEKIEDITKNKSIDAVIIATPSPTHAAFTKMFLLSGHAVFVEKPMALTLADAEELFDITQKESSPLLMVGHLLIYHPALESVHRLIASEEIGTLYYIYTKRLNLGIVRKDENALWSLAPHDISIVLDLIEEKPNAVSATGSAYVNQGIEDVVFLTLSFPSGRIAQIHVSWLDPHKERKVVVVGSKKMVVFDDMQPNEKVKVYDKGAEVEGSADYIESISIRHGDINIPLVPSAEPLMKEMEHFISCVKNDTSPRSGAGEGLAVVRILTAGVESLKSHGKTIELT
jgi:predicted dehydrogenase